MPHFSPISWLFTGVLFYLSLVFFVSLFWWYQNFMFLKSFNMKNLNFTMAWNWL